MINVGVQTNAIFSFSYFGLIFMMKINPAVDCMRRLQFIFDIIDENLLENIT